MCTIHSALLASLSPSLNALVNGEMREARERRVEWDIDEQTLSCFFQFAYAGYYDFSISYLRAQALAQSEDGDVMEHECTCKIRRVSDWNGCGNDGYGFCSCSAPLNKCLCGDLRRILEALELECSAHQKLLIFADYHGIWSLVNLVCQNILGALEESIEVSSARVVTELLRNSYSLPNLNILHDCLLPFVFRNRKRFWKFPGFRELLRDKNRLSVDLIVQILDEDSH